jgi:photosystem II stability/assembly factor-like uncharacterized protein
MNSTRIIFSLFVSLACATQTNAQTSATPADLRLKGFETHKSQAENSIFKTLEPESIGPSIFSCRVTDVDVDPADPTRFYVAYASGGLWFTESNGTSFKPLFDHEASMTIGDIAVDWRRNLLWVGTGEVNSSRSSYAGTGIYRSADGGKTWENRGLPESHHIARIVLDPENPDVLWVAVLGHLYSPNAERGVYKTTDGGKNWKRVLFVDENAGAIDLIHDPSDRQVMYASTWQRERRAWNFSGAGSGSAIWKSTDQGETWQKISTKESGFPDGAYAGRIGLTAGRKAGKTVLYASIDNQTPLPPKENAKATGITKDQLRSISVADFLKLPDDKISEYLKKYQFPEKYNAKKVKDMVEKGKISPISLVEYLEDANNNLFETDYTGAEVYRSEDGGKTWKRTHEKALEGINFTYGYYFSNIRCMPDNPDQLYLLGFIVIRSDDGGKTWKSISGPNVHADHHALWLNAARPGHLIDGNDGGINISWDNGASWIKCNNPPVGQFYAIATDENEPYRVYGGAQDNGVWVGPSDFVASTDWHQSGHYPYKELLGGDGMQVAVDPRDNNTVYTGFQFGNYFRIERTSGKQKYITPKHALGERPLRFNWQTPIHLSKHNPDVFYIGAQKLYRSLDKGDHWESISEDLTSGGQKGNVPYGTLTTIHESPLKFGLLYTGSDDGHVQITKDGGENWTDVSKGLPAQRWVSRVQASAHERGRVYASLNGYRQDDFSAYMYVSEDFGQNWIQIGLDLPAEPINVIREDPENPDLLYVGTDHGLYCSVDLGAHFSPIGSEFPNTPVHDLVVQASAHELVVGTHGRSLYKMDVTILQQLTAARLNTPIYVIDALDKIKYDRSWGKKQPWDNDESPELQVPFYVNEAGVVNWKISTKSGLLLNSGTINCTKGLNNFTFGLNIAEDSVKKYQKALNDADPDAKKPIEITKSDDGQYYLRKGVYSFEFERAGKIETRTFEIE